MRKLQSKIKDLINSRPKINAYQIAKELDCSPEYVRVAARRLGLKLPKVYRLGISERALGRAAREAGMTLDDIKEWKNKNVCEILKT